MPFVWEQFSIHQCQLEVSMQLIVTLLLLEAYGPTMIEILLTARGVVSVCGMLSFSRTDYSAAEACSESEWVIFVFLDRRTLGFVRVCVSVRSVYDCEHQCVHVLMN